MGAAISGLKMNSMYFLFLVAMELIENKHYLRYKDDIIAATNPIKVHDEPSAIYLLYQDEEEVMINNYVIRFPEFISAEVLDAILKITTCTTYTTEHNGRRHATSTLIIHTFDAEYRILRYNSVTYWVFKVCDEFDEWLETFDYAPETKTYSVTASVGKILLHKYYCESAFSSSSYGKYDIKIYEKPFRPQFLD